MKMAALVAIFCLARCSSPMHEEKRKDAFMQRDSLLAEREVNFKTKVYPEALRLAESGDIVTRMGTDLTSFLLSGINPTDSSFSHCGIVSIEHDSVFVYHCIGGEFNPDQKMKREPLADFSKPADCKGLGIFTPNLSDSQKSVLCSQVKLLFGNGLRFDMDFDLSTDDRQYCTEMVAKSIGAIIGKMDWAPIFQSGNIRFIPVENIYHNKLVREKKRFVY
jgi:Permuted papain-like amidase enzyme, YaeF/YiiX, C92 family